MHDIAKLFVWNAREVCAADPAACVDVLDASERARHERFLDPDVALLFAGAHAGMRRHLGRWLGCAPNALRFAADANGRPHLTVPSDARLDFNLSHTGDVAVLAVSANGHVGVDVESPARPIRWDLVARRILSPDDLAAWHALADDATRRDALVERWTLLEAWGKLTGHGLRWEPRAWSVATGEDGRPVVTCHDPSHADVAIHAEALSWCTLSLLPGRERVTALSARRSTEWVVCAEGADA
jgi:phosphopantetheinyl transferase